VGTMEIDCSTLKPLILCRIDYILPQRLLNPSRLVKYLAIALHLHRIAKELDQRSHESRNQWFASYQNVRGHECTKLSSTISTYAQASI